MSDIELCLVSQDKIGLIFKAFDKIFMVSLTLLY